MDKIVGELLGPFARRLAATATLSTLSFWAVGVVLFFWLHPQPVRGCPSGGKDLCGALTGGWARAVPLLACLTVGMVLSYFLLFGQATRMTSMLTGTEWPRWLRHVGTRLESARRRRTKRQTNMTPPVPRALAAIVWFPHRPAEHEAEHDHPTLEPTRLGNVFAAAAQHVRDRHRMDLHTCWRHLPGVATSTEITNLEFASRVLLGQTQAVMWLLTSLAWVPLLPGWTAKAVAAAGVLVLSRMFYRRMCQSAMLYCSGLETVIEKHETELLKHSGRSVSPPSQRSLRLRRPGR